MARGRAARRCARDARPRPKPRSKKDSRGCPRDPRPRALGEEARWRYAYGAALVALKDVRAAERELRAALAGATRDWVRGRVHKELGKLADLAGDRPRALDEYRLRRSALPARTTTPTVRTKSKR